MDLDLVQTPVYSVKLGKPLQVVHLENEEVSYLLGLPAWESNEPENRKYSRKEKVLYNSRYLLTEKQCPNKKGLLEQGTPPPTPQNPFLVDKTLD